MKTARFALLSLILAATALAQIAKVEFFLDGIPFGPVITSPPYRFEWDSTKVPDGPHAIYAKATDAQGRVGTSAPVTFTVQNAAPPPPPPQTSSLATLAASMAPGTLMELTGMNGFQSGSTYIFQTGGGGTVMEYADKAVWDSVSRRFLFFGESDDSGAQPTNRFLQYDDLSNTWSELSRPPSTIGSGGAAHTYEHNAIDPVGRTYFFMKWASAVVETRNLDTGAWGTLPPNTLSEYNQCCRAIEWFPEMESLIHLASGERGAGAGLFAWKKSTNTWSRLAENLPVGNISGFAAYDPIHHVVLFGGGYDTGGTSTDESRVLYKVDALGVVTRLADSPVSLGVMNAVQAVDPVTGQLLVFDKTWKFYSFDVLTNSWAAQNHSIAQTLHYNPYQSNNTAFNVVAASIPTYGVTMFLKKDYQDVGRVLLYKHGAGAPPPPPPPPPTDPCVASPMTAPTGIQWPSSRTGSRQLRWDSLNVVILRHDHRWLAMTGTAQSVTFYDDRNCSVTVTKP